MEMKFEEKNFELFTDRYAWTPTQNKHNGFGVGYFTQIHPDGSTERSLFEQKLEHDMFQPYQDDPMPLGSLVRYTSLYPVLLHDFTKRHTRNTFVNYTDLAEPVDDHGYLVYNGLYNSGKDPRELATNDLTQENLNDLYRGCQTVNATCRELSPNRKGFAHKIVVYVEKINKEGGVLMKDKEHIAELKKMNRRFVWTVRLQTQVNRQRSEDFPYAQPASCVWFREPMGQLHLAARKVCRDMRA
jgi:hypothetical protein